MGFILRSLFLRRYSYGFCYFFPQPVKENAWDLASTKIFTELSGKPILIQTLLTFSHCDCVDELIIAVDINEMEIIRKVLSKIPKLKPYKIVSRWF